MTEAILELYNAMYPISLLLVALGLALVVITVYAAVKASKNEPPPYEEPDTVSMRDVK